MLRVCYTCQLLRWLAASPRLIDKKKLESRPKTEMLPFQDIIYQEIERSKTSLKQEWCPAILDIFRQCQKNKRKRILPPETR